MKSTPILIILVCFGLISSSLQQESTEGSLNERQMKLLKVLKMNCIGLTDSKYNNTGDNRNKVTSNKIKTLTVDVERLGIPLNLPLQRALQEKIKQLVAQQQHQKSLRKSQSQVPGGKPLH